MESFPTPELLDKINTLCQLPLAPMDYCHRWVKQDSYRNYRKVCIHAIAQVTGISPKTVKGWGTNFHRCPDYVTRMLRQADLINQFKQLLLNGIITLPPDFPHE